MEQSFVAGSEASRMTRGYLICFFGTAVWSTTGILIRYLTENFHLPALVLAAWRDVFVSVAMGMILLLASPTLRRVDKSQFTFLLSYGFILSLFNSLWTVSVAINGAAVATVLAYSSAAFTAILGWRLFGERLDAIKVIAVLLSLLGCVFTAEAYDINAWRLNPLGVVAGLTTGLAFAGYSLMGKAASRRALNSWSTLFYTFFIAALFLLAYNFLASSLPIGIASANLFWLGDSFIGWALLVLLAVGPTIGGYGLYTLSLDYLPASVANIIATLEPVMTAALAYLFLNERFTLPQWIGGALILLGVFMLRLRSTSMRNASHPTDPPAVT